MRCVKCQALNAEDATACSLCHEAFLSKVPPSVKRLALPWLAVEIEGWRFDGPAIVAAEGIYCFVKRSENRLPWLARAVTKVLGRAFGVLGGMAVDRIVDLVEEAPRRLPELRFGHRLDIPEVYDRSMAEAPQIAGCSRYILIPRAEIRELAIPWGDVLTLRTDRHAVELRGDLPVAELSGLLVLWGFPLERGARRGRFPKGRTLGAIAAVAAVALIGAEAFELEEAGAWLSTLPWIQALYFRADGTLDTLGVGAAVGAALYLVALFKFRASKPDS